MVRIADSPIKLLVNIKKIPIFLKKRGKNIRFILKILEGGNSALFSNKNAEDKLLKKVQIINKN